MKPETLKALKLSIKKWKGIVAGTEKDLQNRNCALCKRFGRDCIRMGNKIEKCPVYEATGIFGCHRTPYEDWMAALFERDVSAFLNSNSFIATDDETVMCAVLELEFLKDLLPGSKK